MNLTKQILRDHKIYNSFDILKVVGNSILIDYIPADNSRLMSRYAYWRMSRFEGDNIYKLEKSVTCREEKPVQLEIIRKYVRSRYGLDMTDKDPFGAYHPAGTLQKLIDLIK